MYWAHRVLREPDFCSTWNAIEKARGLALEIGTYSTCCIEPDAPVDVSSELRSGKSGTSIKRVTFDSEIDFLFGHEDQPWAHSMRVPDVCDLPLFRSWNHYFLNALAFPGSAVRSCVDSAIACPVHWTLCATSCTVNDLSVPQSQSQQQSLIDYHRLPFSLPFTYLGTDGSTVEEPLLLSALSPTTCAQLPQSNYSGMTSSIATADVHSYPPADPTHAQSSSGDGSLSSSVAPASGGRDPYRPHFDDMPIWVHHIWHQLQTEGTVENTDEGLVVYFNTYYISHWTNVRQPFGRAVRLDRHFRSWERVLRLMWGDLFDHNEPFDVVLVVPESPFAVEPEAVGTLLIIQHPHAQRAACVTTAVLFHADVLDVCEHRIRQYLGECTIRVGRYQYPQVRPVRVHDGLRLLVDVPPPMAPQDWEDRLHHRLQQRAREAPGITFPEEEFEEEPDDISGLLARLPVASLNVGGHLASSPPSSMSTSSATDSATSSATIVESDEWHLALIFSLDGAEREIDVPWHDGQVLFERVAQRFGINPSEIAAVHTVLPCPQDLCHEERRAMLLQRQIDQPAAPFLRLILVDVEYKQDASGPALLLERRVRWFPQRCTRSSAIRLAGYDGHCSQDPERCWLWHNGHYVDASHDEPLVLDSGNYVRIAIPANPNQAICETGEAYWPSDHDDYHWPPDLDEASLSSDDEESAFLQSAIVHWKLDSDDLVEPALSRACISTDTPQALVRPHGHPDDFQLQEDPLWRLWHRPHLHTRGLNNEPVLLFETWYVSGLGYPKCTFSRAVALDEDLDSWISKLRQVWHDRIHPQAPLELSIVHPEVPNVRHGGHLILLQAVPPHQRASPLSSYWDLDRQELHDRFAQVVPRRLSFHDLLRFNDLGFVCQQPNFHCVAFVGPHQFEPHEAWPIYHGMHLEVHVGAPVQAALDMPLAGDAAEPDAFQPGQPAGPHPMPDLTQVSSFTRELLDLWSRLAFSWEGEVTSLDVVTWMVDHHDNDLSACHHPRIVQLSAAYPEWELQIRHAWADLLNDNLPAAMYVVTPIPPSLVQGASVHVIVVQRPFVAFATILLTAIDHTVSAPPRPLQVAITTLEQVYLDHLLIGIGLEERCLADNVRCQAWHAEQELQMGVPLQGRNGLSIILEISALASTGDGVTFLQLAHHIQPTPSLASSERLTNASVAHAHWPEDKPSDIQLDLTEAWSCFETYDQSFLLPCFDLDPAFHTAWTDIWWDCQSVVTHIWIYHDGSHKAQGAGAAAVAFLFQPGCGWVFGGALSAAFSSSTTSYGAEVRSGILAVQFAIDILKITTLHQPYPPEVCLLHDNTTVGAQLTGHWHANADVRAVALMRHLAVYCERRFNLELSTRHVSAHTGDVGNELADVLAGLAADQKPLMDLHDWFVRVLSLEFGQAAAWFWLFFDAKFASWWTDLCLCLPNQASTAPSIDVLPTTSSPTAELDAESGVVDLVVGTCNVLTLKTDARRASLEIPIGISGPTRQHIIFKQFKDAGVCIAVLQETRLQRHCKLLEDYMIYAGAATPQGHFGVLAAISTTIPYGHVSQPHGKPKKLYFSKSDIAVVSSSPRWIVLRVATPWIKFVLIGAHAPHSGQSVEIIDAWWTSLAQTLPPALASWPRILLADANAKVGADHCSHIGDVGAEMGGDKAVPFTTFVRDQHLWLPSTFDCHQGPSGTWRHSSQQWTVNTCRSWVSEDIDVSLHHEDHCAALVHFTLDVTPRGVWRRTGVWKHHAEDADLSALRWLHPLDRGLDVHSHAAAMQQQILDCLPSMPRQGSRKMKYTMSDHTWDLVRQKRRWRTALHEAQALQRQTLLHGVFLHWKAHHDQLDPLSPEALDRILRDQDRLIAQALFEFRVLGRMVSSSARADDRAFFGQVLCEGEDYLHPSQSRELWRVIKKALPKHQQRQQGVDPLSLMHLEDCWNPHFECLEAGQTLQASELLEAALSDDRGEPCPPPRWTALPTLFELEQALRSNKSGRSTGADPLMSALWHNQPAALAAHSFALMIKVWLWGQEPLQYKGGPLALLPKRPHPSMVQHFRGILLLPTLAKGFHALLRRRIIAILHPIRAPGQLGGFAQQEVLYGSHALRLLGQLAVNRGLSIGVLFVDLATAFHSLIREMVVGTSCSERLNFVLSSLQRQGHPCDHLRLGRELPGLLTQLGASASLVRLLQNIHSHTWMTIGSQGYIKTHKGTRPGSPLADAIFHFIMYEVFIDLRKFLTEEGHQSFLTQHFDIDLEPIIWSDDLAVPLVTAHCRDLVPALLKLLDYVRDLFLQRGFTLNLAKGKTGVVATFCGADAPALRREIQLVAQPGVHHQFPDGFGAFVHFSPAYRHLGTLYTSDQKLSAEIAARIGMASSAFSQVSRRLLLNKHLPCSLRLQLFRSLILSKLYFGMGAWHTPPGNQLDRLKVTVVRMVRKILKLPAGPSNMSSAQILVYAEVPEPRVQLAMDRLLYAQRLFHHGPAFLQHLVHVEAASHVHSWLAGLRHDLQWLYGVEAVPDETLRDFDHTQLIEYWQSSASNWRSRVRVHTHRRKAHGVYSPEHHLLDSATCPACLTFLWSTQRLQQHLAYMPRDGRPNPCFAYLQRIGFSVSYSALALPKSMQGQSRFDALPVAGPDWAGVSGYERELSALRAEQHRILEELADYEIPETPQDSGEKLAHILTQLTRQWYAEFCAAQYCSVGLTPLRDRWLDSLCRLPVNFESWASRAFLAWGEHILPDLIATLLDGEAESLIEDAFADLAGDLHEYQLALRLRQIELCVDRLHAQLTADPVPHRPVRPPQDQARPRQLPLQAVPRLFEGQVKWHEDLRQVEWEDMPDDPLTPMVPDLTPRPSFVIVHLFAGRRRHTDLHAHLEAWAHQRNFSLTILSLDTAIAPVLGNLDQRSITWQRLQDLYSAGCVAATVSGHPCETFSSARWHRPPEGFEHVKWPRPLRTAMNLFGLDHRTLRELLQTKVGTVFFLQTAWALANHLVHGGLFIEEHPDIPIHDDHPSIWRSALLQFFCKHPDIHLHHIRQWRFGAPTSKPTGLLGLRLPQFGRDLYSCALADAVAPAAHAIGLNESGEFRTAVHKEYPPALSKGLATVLANQLQRDYWARRFRVTAPVSSALQAWISEVAHVCRTVRDDAAWLPDFQG
eukprot:s1767_g12.t1